MLPSIFSKQLRNNFHILTQASSSLAAPVKTTGGVRQSIENLVDVYEEFIGVKAVKQAQDEVMNWEEKLSSAQLARRQRQAEINDIQARLKEIHFDLDRTSRGEDKYLQLLTEEHSIIKKERELLRTFEGVENEEREAFHQLSNRVRNSHEKERERAEKTKWWGVSASLTGALLGILGTSIGNELRMRKLREMLPIGGAQMSEMARAIDDQNQKVSAFLGDLRTSMNLGGETLKTAPHINDQQNYEELVKTIKSENQRLSDEMKELSRLAKLEAAIDADPNAVVYVGNEMERLLDQTERNIESKMKLQTLLTVVFLYTAVAVTAPWLYAIFRGG